MSGRSSKAKRREEKAAIVQQPSVPEGVTLRQIRLPTIHIAHLPSPETLAAYQKYVPDAPERILVMTEKEQDARIEREREMAAAVQRDAVSSRSAQLVSNCINSVYNFYT